MIESDKLDFRRHPQLTESQEFAIHQLEEGDPWIFSWDEFILIVDNSYRVDVGFGETVDQAARKQIPKWLLLALSERKNPLPGLAFLWNVRVTLHHPILDACVVRIQWSIKSSLRWVPEKALRLFFKLFKPLSDLALWILGRRLR